MKNKKAQVFHFDLYGKREDKYNFLNDNSLQSIAWTELKPDEPNFFFVNKNFAGQKEYENGFKVDELFMINNSGLATEFDDLSIKETKKEAELLLKNLQTLDANEILNRYALDLRKKSKVENAINDVSKNTPKVTIIGYRPFDHRFTIYTGLSNGIMGRPRNGVMQHMLKDNLALLTCRQQTSFDFQHVFITKSISERCSVSLQTGEVSYVFPLYLYPEPTLGAEAERIPNFNMEIVNQIAEKLGLTFTAEKFPSIGGVAESRGGTLSSTEEAPKILGGTLSSTEEISTNQGGRNTQNYMSLPYNPKLKERARELRKAGNLSEVLFWNQVKNKQFKGLDFDRQKIIGNYIVDFYCANCNVVVEIDGSSHDNKQEYDAERDAFLESLGLTVIHIPIADVMNNMGAVIEMLLDHPALKGTPPADGNFAPIDILDYIYAVLHSPTYREKYKEFLKIDFPRVPYPKNQETFWKLVELGSQIRKIHLLESPIVEKYITQYPIDGDNVVGKPRFEISSPPEGCPKDGVVGKVFINETQYFDNVPQIAWEFYIGGYQPAQKWLKDRKDRALDFEDILHYQKIIVALTETDRLMKEIDKLEIE